MKRQTTHGNREDGKRRKDNKEDDIQYSEIDPVQYRASFEIVTTSAVIRSIITYFCNSCMSNEILIIDGNDEEIKLSASFRDIISTYYIPLAMRAIRWILVAGVVPVSFENITKDLCVPIIPDHDCVRVSCARNPDGFRTMYRAQDEASGKEAKFNFDNPAPVESMFQTTPARATGAMCTGNSSSAASSKNKDSDTNLFVVSDFSVPSPTHKGKLQSPFATVLCVIQDLKVLEAQRNRALQYLVDPPLITTVSDKGTEEADRGLSFEVVGGTNVLYNTQAAAVQHAKNYARENPDALLDLNDDQFGDHGELSEFVNAALRNAKKNKVDCITLPTNHVLARQHLPIVPPEYMATVKMLEEKMCALFGLPLGIVMGYVGSHRTSSSKAFGATNASNVTEMHIAQIAVSRVRLDLEMFLTRILKVACYKNHYGKEKLKKNKDKTPGTKVEMGHQQIFESFTQDAMQQDAESEVHAGLEWSDLLPIGAHCKLKSMEYVARSEEQSIMDEQFESELKRETIRAQMQSDLSTSKGVKEKKVPTNDNVSP